MSPATISFWLKLWLCARQVGGFYVTTIPVWIAWMKYLSFGASPSCVLCCVFLRNDVSLSQLLTVDVLRVCSVLWV